MRLSLNTLKLLAGAGDKEAKCLLPRPTDRLPWAFVTRRGTITATCNVLAAKGRTRCGLQPALPPIYDCPSI